MSNGSTMTNFSELIEDLDGGVFADKVGAALSAVSRGVVEYDKVGEVTIKLKMKRIGNSQQVAMSHTLSYTQPTANGKVSEDNSTETPLHVGRGGKITIFPENQGDMFKTPAAKQGASA